MKTAVAFTTGVTIVACVFLACSYLVLKGTADLSPIWRLVWLMVLCAATLVAVALRSVTPRARWLMIVVGASVVWIGWSRIEGTLAGPHFEGYNLVLGAMAMMQGLLTALAFAMTARRSVRRRVFPAEALYANDAGPEST